MDLKNTQSAKVTFYCKYDNGGASTRYRTLQYFQSLKDAGFIFQYSSLFSDNYLFHKFKFGRSSPSLVFYSYLKRLVSFFVNRSDSVVWIEYELFPYFPAVLERLIAKSGVRYIVDFDDAIFHTYDNHKYFIIRFLFKFKIATVMRLAHTVVVGNKYLGDYARAHGAKNVVTIPTVIDLKKYPCIPATVKPAIVQKDCFIIGWIGTPITARYIQTVAPALRKVCAGGRAKVQLIGAGDFKLDGVPLEVLPWSESDEVEFIRGFDVGIMPLPDDPWTRGKCGFKLIQYMACSLPVIASPIGINKDIVEPGKNGFLADKLDDWEEALATLQRDIALRRRMGANGRNRVEKYYNISVTAPKFIEVLREAIG